jgi:transposase
MSKYSYDQKLEAVKGVIEKGLSFQAAGNILGADKGNVRKWVRLYLEHGTEGLVMKKGTYDGQFKISVIEYMHKNNLSIKATAAKFGIPSDATVGKWERIYYEEGSDALFRDNRRGKKMKKENKPRKPKIDKKVKDDLIAEVQNLRMENAYLKKLNALVLKRVQLENGKR